MRIIIQNRFMEPALGIENVSKSGFKVEEVSLRRRKKAKVPEATQMVMRLDFSGGDESDYKCFQANDLTFAFYSISPVEKKFMSIMIASLLPDQEAFQTITLKVNDVLEALEGKGSKNYKFIERVIDRLQTRVIEIQEVDKQSRLKVQLVGHARYLEGIGIIECSFPPALQPYLLNLKKKFTAYKLGTALKLDSFYSQRFYEMLCSYKDTGYYITSVDNIRKTFCLGKRYKLYNDLKRVIIVPAQKELKEKTDIEFTFEEKKEGRKVKAIEFFIVDKEKNREQNEEVEKAYKALGRCELSEAYANELIKRRKVPPKEIIRTVFEIMQIATTKGRIKTSVAAYARGVFDKKFPEQIHSDEDLLPLETVKVLAQFEGITIKELCRQRNYEIAGDFVKIKKEGR